MRKFLLLAAIVAALASPASATLTTTNSVVSFTSNGVTVAYATGFRFLDNSHLVVTKTVAAVTTTLVLGTDYTVTGANATAGGTVTLNVAVANGGTLKIARSTPKTQLCNLRSQGAATYKSVEDCLDREQMQIQEMNDGTFTSLIVTPITTAQATVAAPSTIPNAANSNTAGSSAAFSAADHSHALAVGPMLGATTAAGQSIPNGAQTIVVYGTVERDTDSGYNAGTGRYTIPVGKGGDYLIVGVASWNAAFVGTGAVSIFKNAVQMKVTNQISPAALQSQSVSAVLNLAAGDVIDIRVLQTSAGAVVLQNTALDNYFALKRIQ